MKIPEYVSNDQYLLPYADYITRIIEAINKKEKELCNDKNLIDFANGHLYYGLHKTNGGYVIREWLPNAKNVYFIGDINNWQKSDEYKFTYIGNGNWELHLDKNRIKHKDLYKLIVEWEGGEGERIPAWARYVVQDEHTKIFSAQVWFPQKPYKWKHKKPQKPEFPLIYEAHIGMSSEEEKVSTYNEFRVNILPRIVELGYNTIQLMAIQEHPYYGSFGYHVSSFFAPSSRFGTPDELKQLIDEAHSYGLYVIMDLIHSHAAKNEVEGISRYDGTEYQFFHAGAKGNHILWDSRCFNYGKNEVLHFLLSNCKYWLEEFNFDGFRFDGVTSMLYFDHALGRNFLSYQDYFNENLDIESLVYLALANKLIHEVNKNAITIAEDVSGFPGLALKIEDGGLGFDYRLAMGVPDFWIKYTKDVKDENWHVGDMFYHLTNKRAEEKVISYVESHDQAIVGDKTIFFRLVDAECYWNMEVSKQNLIIDRGISLHKLIRLVTITTAGGGYLNFMGNEFGHPEWIDFPRQGNNWSYKYARRQWSLCDNPNLKYKYLYNFDKAMIELVKKFKLLNYDCEVIDRNNDSQILIFKRGQCLCLFNFNPLLSFTDYPVYGVNKAHRIALNSDDVAFGGFNRIDNNQTFFPLNENNSSLIKVYLPARTALVLYEV